jgi:hypothetical protein
MDKHSSPGNTFIGVGTLQIFFLFFCKKTICLKDLIPLEGGLKRAPLVRCYLY